MERPQNTLGLRHVALYVEDLAACKAFYVDIVGMRVEWQPDDENIYLTSGYDNLALHKGPKERLCKGSLDHIGFILKDESAVEDWYAYLKASGVEVAAEPKKHRDGAMSFYVRDPAQHVVQFIYHPPLVENT